ncbi:MAG: hypothetical protein U0166_21300 [Acidobacteriota bacterium]
MTSAPRGGNLYVLLTGFSAVTLFGWDRYHATATAFLATGLVLAVAFSGAITLAILVKVGALSVRPVALTHVLHVSTLLLAVHFASLFVRRNDLETRLAVGREAVRLIERQRSAGGLPASLDALDLDPRARSLLTYEQVQDGYRICFSSPGGVSCYQSRSGKWEVRP